MIKAQKMTHAAIIHIKNPIMIGWEYLCDSRSFRDLRAAVISFLFVFIRYRCYIVYMKTTLTALIFIFFFNLFDILFFLFFHKLATHIPTHAVYHRNDKSGASNDILNILNNVGQA